MKLSKIFIAVITTAAVLGIYQVAEPADDKSKFSDSILYDDLSITGQFVELLGDRPTKFEEYREVATGPQGQNEILMVGSPNSSLYGYFEGFDLFRRDQSVFVEFGKPGDYKVNFEFNQIPHKYSRSARTIEQDPSTGHYTVDTATRTQLQGSTAAGQAALVRQLTPGFTERDMETERDRFNWNISKWLSESLQMELTAGFEIREGLRKKGTGTYMRTGDTFEIRGIELPEPVEYQTLDLGARLTYAVPKSVTSLDWAMSYFHNEVDSIVWDNPFRITDSAATGALGAANRGNFARGRVSLYPDNIANTITLSQAWTLPYKTSFTGSASYGIYFQNDPFFSYTTNSAINTLAGFSVDDTSNLPQSSLEGSAAVISANFTVINRAIDRLKAKVYMNMYDYIDNTESIRFPGYAAFGDSYWLTNITTNVAGDPIIAHRPSFLDLKSGVSLDYEVTKMVSLNSGYEFKYRNLKNRSVSDIFENTFKNGIQIRPCPPVKMEGSYSYGWRDFSGGYLTYREMPDGKMYDIAAKNRNQVDARIEVEPNEKLTIGASGMWRRDGYRIDYGLEKSDAINLSLDTEYAPSDRWSLYTYYSYDRSVFNIKAIAKSGAPNPAYPISNTWFSDTTENTNTLGTGIRYSFIPDKLTMDVGYSFSLALQKIVNSNLVPNPVSPLVATAYEWPVVRSDWQEVKVQLKYKMHKNLEIKAYYNFELYNLNDFAWDSLQPYMQAQTADNSTQYLWLDSRYSDYIAHVYGVALKYIF